jgi:hypothetical protein
VDETQYLYMVYQTEGGGYILKTSCDPSSTIYNFDVHTKTGKMQNMIFKDTQNLNAVFIINNYGLNVIIRSVLNILSYVDFSIISIYIYI